MSNKASANNHLTTVFFGLANQAEFIKGVQHAVNQINGQQGIYTGDNLITWHRNLGFLEDKAFMKAAAAARS